MFDNQVYRLPAFTPHHTWPGRTAALTDWLTDGRTDTYFSGDIQHQTHTEEQLQTGNYSDRTSQHK